MIKYQDLISDIKKHKVLPLYLLFGEEEFLIQEALDLIIKEIVDAASADFNFNTVYCRDTSAAEIVSLAQTLPFMSEKRLVIAKEIDAFKAADLEELVPYLNDPSPATCLVMVSSQGKYDKKSVVSAVEARGAVVRVYPLLEREIVGWIEGWAVARGLSLQRDAAQYLWQITGNDLQKIVNELQKVEIYVKDGKTVTFEDVKTVVGDFREYTSFDLAAAVGQKNPGKALLILSRLIQEGEAPVGLLGAIAWNFRRLLQAKSMEEAGMGPDEILRKLRVIFHQTAIFKEQLRRHTVHELRGVFPVMLSTDRALKSSSLNGKLLLERMILKLCGVSRTKKNPVVGAGHGEG
ncbi:MAG TPA: DNA polymerase III subunit delta [Nitrospirota bacterium]|nr:DNA polymerase III subunit delta [Nitrospirota bacterium]